MDHRRDRKPHDELQVRRLVVVDGEDRPRVVLEVVDSGVPRNGGVKAAPRVSLLGERGRPVLVLEVDAQGEARIRVGDPDRGAVAELEAGLLLLGLGGNTRALLSTGRDHGVLHLCDEDGRDSVRIPNENGE